MKYSFNLILGLVLLTTAAAQKPAVIPGTLTPEQIAALFPANVQGKLNIQFPIYRVYKYADKLGQYYCLLTESADTVTGEGDTLNHKIKAINVRSDNGVLLKQWEINDSYLHDKEELSIWFASKYMDFRDYDADGLVEPIIVYATAGVSGYDSGRIKFIIYYKGKKVAIRHQNGVLDWERETHVDKAFYDLPQSLQAAIKQKMELMMKNNHAIFPAGWKEAMRDKKVVFNER